MEAGGSWGVPGVLHENSWGDGAGEQVCFENSQQDLLIDCIWDVKTRQESRIAVNISGCSDQRHIFAVWLSSHENKMETRKAKEKESHVKTMLEE